MQQIIDHYENKKDPPEIDPTSKVWFEIEGKGAGGKEFSGVYHPGTQGRAVIKFNSTIGRTIRNPQVVLSGRIGASHKAVKYHGSSSMYGNNERMIHYYSNEQLFALSRPLGDDVTLNDGGDETSWMVDFQFPWHCDDNAAPGESKMLPPSFYFGSGISSRFYCVVEYRLKLICSLSDKPDWKQSTFMSDRLDFQPWAEPVANSTLDYDSKAISFPLERLLGTAKHSFDIRNPFGKHPTDPQMNAYLAVDKVHKSDSTFPISVRINIDHLPAGFDHAPEISIRFEDLKWDIVTSWKGHRVTKPGFRAEEDDWYKIERGEKLETTPPVATVQGKVMEGNRIEYQTSFDVTIGTNGPSFEVNNMKNSYGLKAKLEITLGGKKFEEKFKVEGIVILPNRTAGPDDEAPLYSHSQWQHIDEKAPGYFEYYPEL